MSPKSSSHDKHNSLQHFCSIPCISYWRSQIHSSNIKNIKTKSACHAGTKKCYTYGLFGFHKWLQGKRFEYMSTIQTNETIFNMQKKTVIIKGVDHFFDLYRHGVGSKTEFITFIKKYLIHLQSTKNASTIDNAIFSIKSFFRENDSEVDFRFTNTKRRDDPIIENTMTLDEMRQMLSVKGIQAIEKAVFMCKFQRGLDSATLADRFNFDAWKQITEHFGTDDPDMWDITKCPVPIKLVRVKTNYMHTGFLDVDAVLALKEYLQWRGVANAQYVSKRHIARGAKSNTHIRKKPLAGEALFLDTLGNPISINWIGRRFSKLRRRSGVRKTYFSHEMRDLLKSTLIDSGCRPDIADHVIGHSPKDSYEKQAILYPENMRTEFSKASDRINVLVLGKSTRKYGKSKPSNPEYIQVEASVIDELIYMNTQMGETLRRIRSNANSSSRPHK